MKTRKAIYLNTDVMDISGNWLRSWTETDSESHIQYHSISGKRYRAMMSRCNPESKDYQGSICKFYNFQEFVNWSIDQVGYLSVDAGKLWAIDKDIIHHGKIYSPDTCMFVPQWVNNLVLEKPNSKANPDGLLGVSWSRSHSSWAARCSDGRGGEHYLGFHQCKYSAHKLWQRKRFNVLMDAVGIFQGLHPKLADALELRAINILNDITSGKITSKY